MVATPRSTKPLRQSLACSDPEAKFGFDEHGCSRSGIDDSLSMWPLTRSSNDQLEQRPACDSARIASVPHSDVLS